jgi:hypothetical protein
MKKTLLLMFVLAFAALAQAQHSVVLSWTAPAPQAGVTINVYNVYRSDTSGGQVAGTHPLDPSGVAGLTFTDSTVVGGQTYYYKVAAWCATCSNGKGGTGAESPFSNEYKAVIPSNALVPGAPTITTVVIQ